MTLIRGEGPHGSVFGLVDDGASGGAGSGYVVLLGFMHERQVL